MIATVAVWLAAVIAVEAATELYASSKLTAGWRQRLARIAFPPDRPPGNSMRERAARFVYELSSCGYCSSVWIAAVAARYPAWPATGLAGWLCTTLVLHRLSNWLHVAYELLRRGRVHTIDLSITAREDEQSNG